MKIIVIIVVLLAAMTGLAAAQPQVIDRGTAGGAVALTIEDVAGADELAAVLRLLREEGAKATFFFAGRDVAGLPVKQAVAAGHEVGNHGFAHGYWGEAAPAAVAADLAAGEKAVAAATGAAPRVVRPPYGHYGDNFLRAAATLTPPAAIIRGVDAGDWLVDTPEAVAAMVREAAGDGAIVNINMRAKAAAAALPAIIRDLKGKGLRLVTASELLRQAPAARPGGPAPGGAAAVVRRVETGRPLVALTFDDGGPAWRAAEILDVLKAAGARSTFFVTGEWARANPELVRRMAAEGHEVANHSYSHPRFSRLDAAGMRAEITAAAEAVRAALGTEGARLFRPPYGVYDGTLTAVLGELGYRALVLWDVDSRDWTGLAAEAIAARAAAAGPGSVVLFHLQGPHTAAALAEIIPLLRGRGWELTTVGRLLEGEARMAAR